MIIKIIAFLKKSLPRVDNRCLASNIFPILKCMCLSLGILFFLNSYYELRSPLVYIIGVSVLCNIVLLLIKKNKSNMVMYFLITIVISILLFGGLLFKISYREFLYNTYNWCKKYNGEDALFQRNYSMFSMFILILAINISIYFLHKFKLVIYLFSLLFPVGLIILTINGFSISKITIACVFLYVLPVLTSVMGKSYKNRQNEFGASGTTMYLMPVYCIMIIIAILMPSSKDPIRWEVIKEIASNIGEKGAYIRNKLEYFADRKGKEFTYSTAGYEEREENELGGLLETDNMVSLLVTTNGKTRAKGYLIGSIYDIYTGHGFKKSQEKKDLEQSDFYYDYIELLNTLGREWERGTNLNNIIGKRSYKITFKNIRTRTIFQPSKTIEINLPKNAKYEETTLGSMVLNRAKGMGYSYDLTYYELNLESEVLKELFRNGDKHDEISSLKGINKVQEEYLYSDDLTKDLHMPHLYEDVYDRREKIYKTYTKLPSTITDRTKELAYELTKNFDNDYDKLKSIEAFLNTYEYTTNVSKVKKNTDFVDNFLFEEKRGYCTYYAASMVVLARCVNIPIRYIEGFIVDYNEKEGNSTYKVLNRNAHAWVEGYIKGIGWIPFEPTSAFYQSRYTGWVDNSNLNVSNPSGLPGSYLDNTQSDYDKLVDELKIDDIGNDNGLKYIFTGVKVFILLLIIIILTIIFILIYYYFLEKRYNKKYRNRDNSKKVLILVNELFRLLPLDGHKLLETETLLQFCYNRGQIIMKDISFLEVVILYMKVRYGEEIIGNEELELVTKFMKEYKNFLTSKVGKLKMFYYRFFYLISIND
jgi:hypothetical protein